MGSEKEGGMAAGGDSHWHYRVEVAHALHVGEGVGL